MSSSLLRVPSTSVVETFSPFQRKVSPVRSLKYMWPYLSMIRTSPAKRFIVVIWWGKSYEQVTVWKLDSVKDSNLRDRHCLPSWTHCERSSCWSPIRWRSRQTCEGGHSEWFCPQAGQAHLDQEEEDTLAAVKFQREKIFVCMQHQQQVILQSYMGFTNVIWTGICELITTTLAAPSVKVVFDKLTRFTGNADAIGSPDELHCFFVHPHQSDGIDEGQNLTVEATRANLVQNQRQTSSNRGQS